MKHETDFSDIFDDDFEVTYEDDWENSPYTDRYSRQERASHGSGRGFEYEDLDNGYEDDDIGEDDDQYEDNGR